jgi:hypothetical protein
VNKVEDNMVKVNGEWLSARRRICNAATPESGCRHGNPVTHPGPLSRIRAPGAPRSD